MFSTKGPLIWGQGTRKWIAGTKEFIRRVINAMERQTDRQYHCEASEPELDIMAVTLQGGIWAHAEEVRVLLIPF